MSLCDNARLYTTLLSQIGAMFWHKIHEPGGRSCEYHHDRGKLAR